MDQILEIIAPIVSALLLIYIAITAYIAKVKLKFAESEREVTDWIKSYADTTVTVLVVGFAIYGLYIEFTREGTITRESLLYILLYFFCLLGIFISTILLKLIKPLFQMLELHKDQQNTNQIYLKMSSEQLELIKDIHERLNKETQPDGDD